MATACIAAHTHQFDPDFRKRKEKTEGKKGGGLRGKGGNQGLGNKHN